MHAGAVLGKIAVSCLSKFVFSSSMQNLYFLVGILKLFKKNTLYNNTRLGWMCTFLSVFLKCSKMFHDNILPDITVMVAWV